MLGSSRLSCAGYLDRPFENLEFSAVITVHQDYVMQEFSHQDS
jgi:hypothetical protein